MYAPHLVMAGSKKSTLGLPQSRHWFPRAAIQAIFLRDHVDVDRGIMARWMGKLGFELEILADYTFSRIKRGERIFADETGVAP
jgi:transposase